MLSNIRDGPFTGEDPEEGARCRRLPGERCRSGCAALLGMVAFPDGDLQLPWAVSFRSSRCWASCSGESSSPPTW